MAGPAALLKQSAIRANRICTDNIILYNDLDQEANPCRECAH